MAALTLDFRKHSGTTPADDMAPQIITDWNLHTGLQATWILCLPSAFGTLISKLNCKFTFIWNRTLDPWATVQLFFSLAQVRCFWRCFCFRSGLVALFLKMSERVDSWCTDSSFSSLLVKLSHPWQYSQACGHPGCLCTCSYPIYSFLSTVHLICFDTALCKQPPLSVMTLCDLPSLWRVSMIVFWTIAKSAAFPIVVSKNKRYPAFVLYGWSFIETQM